MITEAYLEWDRLTLYRIKGWRRELIGTIKRNDPLSATDGWTVLMGSLSIGPVPTIEDAQESLEKLA